MSDLKLNERFAKATGQLKGSWAPAEMSVTLLDMCEEQKERIAELEAFVMRSIFPGKEHMNREVREARRLLGLNEETGE